MTWQVHPCTRGPILGFCLSPVPWGPQSLDALLGASTAGFLSLNTSLPIPPEPLLGGGKFLLHSFESFGIKAVTELCDYREGCRASGESFLEHFLLGGGDRDRKSYCFRNNQPDTLVPDYSIASLQWEMRGHTRSSLGHRKFFGLVVDLTEICLEPSQSGAISYCAG